jgi:FtsP/CotA-like multicopper oxidase with cupredoxin domain
MKFTRRNVLFSPIAALLATKVGAATKTKSRRTSIVTPNTPSLQHRMVGNVKEFHLTAEPVKREFAEGLDVNCWGYNGSTPGPTIEAVEGDRVRIFVTNKLPEATSIHWHGFILPNGMDGVTGLNQPKIEPGETYAYEFTLKQHGTLMYHPHFDEMVQIALGMQGFFIIHPRDPRERHVDRDFAIMLNEWFIKPGTATPDPTVMTDFNTFTFNSKVFPATDPLLVRTGDRVRLRIANLSMDSHPIHFHGHKFYITGTEAGPLPESAWWGINTVNVPVGTARDIEFVADNPGDWALHCHKTHHVMNQMGHDLPNLIGIDPSSTQQRLNELTPGTMVMGTSGMGDMSAHLPMMGVPRNSIPMKGATGPYGEIEMGGMFTVLKIRDDMDYGKDPGWYKQPRGTSPWRVSS